MASRPSASLPGMTIPNVNNSMTLNINLAGDAENEKAIEAAVASFEQSILTQPVLLNSLPKAGTHLLRNVMRMFVPNEQFYGKQVVQLALLNQHLEAFRSPRNFLSCGHLYFTPPTAIETARVRRVLLVRDPYSWTLARLRFLISDAMQGPLRDVGRAIPRVDDLINLFILGIPGLLSPLSEVYWLNGLAWRGEGTHVLRYEDLLVHVNAPETAEAEVFFRELLDHCGIAMPVDWQARVRAGSDRKLSSTARETLTGLPYELPTELNAAQKELIDLHAPGVRATLGYA